MVENAWLPAAGTVPKPGSDTGHTLRQMWSRVQTFDHPAARVDTGRQGVHDERVQGATETTREQVHGIHQARPFELSVSKICLGSMHFGPKATEEESHQILDRALEMGINFIDTANVWR